MVYEPQEDSFLLRSFVKKFAKGKVLDMGTGSGIQAVEAFHSKKVSEVYAADIDPEAIDYAKEHNKGHDIKWVLSDLFSKFNLKKFNNYFDTIIFNPPYLPQDHKIRDIALEGGKLGNEVIARFLDEVNCFLKPDGKVLLVFSSLTPNISELLERNLLVGKELGRVHMFFEDIFVYLVKRSPILNELEKKNISCINFFAKGKRGLVFTANYKNKKIAIKVKRKDSFAMNTINHESKILQLVNKHGIGPKFLFNTSKFLVYEFVEGEYLKNLFSSKDIRLLCKKVLEQCFILDLLKVSKQEMTRPFKHVIVKNSKVTLIDFERSRRNFSHNVSQFCTFIMNHIDRNKKKWIKLVREYQKNQSKENFNQLLKQL